MSKDFLNQGILGGIAGVSDRRGFRAISTYQIGSPGYDERYFETYPTIWAGGYAFRKALEHGDPAGLEEWVTLFLLHYFGVIHIREFTEETLRTEFDRDLWTAIYGTFPRPRGANEMDLQSVMILQTNDGITVGAYYPQVVFFPSRGRETWIHSGELQPYLDGRRLSWEKSQFLLSDERERQRFILRLRSIRQVLQQTELKEQIGQFCNANFGSYFGDLEPLDRNPKNWATIVPPNPDEIAETILDEYPLKQSKKTGGVIYFLLEGMDMSYQPSWLTQKLGTTAPVNYVQSGTREITVRVAGRDIKCALADNDEIVALKSLFLSEKPVWTRIGNNLDRFNTFINPKHEVSRLQDNTLKSGDRPICLAPLRSTFFNHFDEVFDDLRNVKAEADPDGNVKWTFYICKREVCWRSKPMKQDSILNTALAMYPPMVSPQWKMYAMFGTGDKELAGRWRLIDESGNIGQHIELESDEYVSVLSGGDHGPSGLKDRNRPRALNLVDAGGNERGILFLSDFTTIDVDSDNSATLALDFGTSNTSFAFRTARTGRSETLTFKLVPKMLWGEEPRLENPGFVPRNWSGEKGFFPSILLTRKSDDQLPEVGPESIELKHLFKADLPCLHNGMSERLISNSYDEQWRVHDNLKWGADARTPWRSLFLRLALFYAHAEVFFSQHAKINRCVLTFPLAFSEDYAGTYLAKAKDSIQQIRHFCYGEPRDEEHSFECTMMDESTAIARSLDQTGLAGLVEVFVDIGGGTTDVAIRHQEKYLVLDSIKVAGSSFFRITDKSLNQPEISGSAQLKSSFVKLIGYDLKAPGMKVSLPLSALYSVRINELDDHSFREREEALVKNGLGDNSYNRYRSKLFFHHLLGYALLQACASVVSNRIPLGNGIKLILGGNGWGLLLFAEWKRSSGFLKQEAEYILELIKESLMVSATDDEREMISKIQLSGLHLLNENKLSEAKNRVALGALKATETGGYHSDTEPFSGINLEGLRINVAEAKPVSWAEKWSLSSFNSKFGRLPEINAVEVQHPENLGIAIDPVLAAFIGMGNTNDGKSDNMPATTWQQMNGGILDGIRKMKIEGGRIVVNEPHNSERLSAAPLNYFLSNVLYPVDAHNDCLDVLAKENQAY